MSEFKKASDGRTSFDIYQMPDCPIKMPRAFSMSQASNDFKHREEQIIEWYESHIAPKTNELLTNRERFLRGDKFTYGGNHSQVYSYRFGAVSKDGEYYMNVDHSDIAETQATAYVSIWSKIWFFKIFFSDMTFLDQ